MDAGADARARESLRRDITFVLRGGDFERRQHDRLILFGRGGWLRVGRRLGKDGHGGRKEGKRSSHP